MGPKKTAPKKPADDGAVTDTKLHANQSQFRATPEGLIPVVFLASSAGYSKGEIAGFDKKVVDDLVKRKVAKKYTAPKTKPEPKGTVTK